MLGSRQTLAGLSPSAKKRHPALSSSLLKVYFKKDLRAVVEKQAVMLEKVSREIV